MSRNQQSSKRPWFEVGIRELDEMTEENPRTCGMVFSLAAIICYVGFHGWSWMFPMANI